MAPSWGPIILGFALMLLSLHPVAVEVASWAVPMEPRADRVLVTSAAFALAGVVFVGFGAFGGRFRRRGEAQRAEEPPPARP